MLSRNNVKRVSVAGTFNNWNHDRDYMEMLEENIWEIELSIPKGRHLYQIVINDYEWIIDPLNPNISEDGQNNSAFTVTGNGEVLIRTTDISEQLPGYLYTNFKAIESPEWIKKAVIYQLHMRAFHEGGFNGLADKIDYLNQLGINVLWLMPFQDIGQEKRIRKYGDPYAVKDYYSIDSLYGTPAELKSLIVKAHDNGIKVILDWVMNRGSVDNLLTVSHSEYFTRNEEGQVYYEVPNRDYFAGLNFDNPDMRQFIIKAMSYWITEFDFDGFRLDDSDLTPFDFLSEIKNALLKVKEDVVLISQSYDEYHHLESCDLTYDGSLRLMIKDMTDKKITQSDFIKIYNSYKYSFPKGALRMRWLEEKERSRTWEYFGENLVKPATSILMTVEGVPFIMMGQEFNERTLNTWTSLFDEYQLDWQRFDQDIYEHYQFLVHLRTRHAALWNGELEFVPNSEEMVLSYVRSSSEDKFLVVINLSESPLVVRFVDISEVSEDLNGPKKLVYRTGKEGSRSDLGNRDLYIDRFETQIYQL